MLAHTLSKTCFYLFGDRIVVFLGLQMKMMKIASQQQIIYCPYIDNAVQT